MSKVEKFTPEQRDAYHRSVDRIKKSINYNRENIREAKSLQNGGAMTHLHFARKLARNEFLAYAFLKGYSYSRVESRRKKHLSAHDVSEIASMVKEEYKYFSPNYKGKIINEVSLVDAVSRWLLET